MEKKVERQGIYLISLLTCRNVPIFEYPSEVLRCSQSVPRFRLSGSNYTTRSEAFFSNFHCSSSVSTINPMDVSSSLEFL